MFTVGDIVVGDAKAGEAYFNGEGGCATCHNATTRNLAGIATRIPEPVDLQQRMLFPGRRRDAAVAVVGRRLRRRARWRRPGTGRRRSERHHGDDRPGVGAADVRRARGRERLLRHVRESDGTVRVVRRTPGMKITKTNPLQAHIDLLDRISDKQIHDLVAYLETLK